MEKIVLATNNKHKLKEIKEVLNNYEILSLEDINFHEEIEENGQTFTENALIKAKAIRKYLKDDTKILADDSGLCCESLNNAPGIYSARYAKNHDDKANRDKVIENLKGLNHKAYFECVLVLLENNDNYKVFEGRTYGQIIEEEKGDASFGYDCIFLSDDLNKTFGEATDDEKNYCSHRGRALEKLINYLETKHDN